MINQMIKLSPTSHVDVEEDQWVVLVVGGVVGEDGGIVLPVKRVSSDMALSPTWWGWEYPVPASSDEAPGSAEGETSSPL